MQNYLYKLIFPECGRLYVGTAGRNRYGKQLPGEQFTSDHHNVEVKNLLEANEFCYFYLVANFSSIEEAREAEENYLHKVWPTDEWSSRPSWLMNRSRSATGFPSGDSHHNKLPHHRERISEWSKKAHEQGIIGVPSNFHGVSWEPNDPRRNWNYDEVYAKVEEALHKANGSYHWGRVKLSEELGVPEVSLKRIARKIKLSWKHS